MGDADHAFGADEGDGRAVGRQDGEGGTGRPADGGVGRRAGPVARAFDPDDTAPVDLSQPRPGPVDDGAPPCFDDGIGTARIGQVALGPARPAERRPLRGRGRQAPT
jgi:hypothetical protein